MFNVRGIGVAVSVSMSTSVLSDFRRSLWRTPKRCSSSMMTRPRFPELYHSGQQAMCADNDVDACRSFQSFDDRVTGGLILETVTALPH